MRKWFLAAWWMARDKRGVSALLLSRELGLHYETAGLMADKQRHALTERPEFSLEGLAEASPRDTKITKRTHSLLLIVKSAGATPHKSR